MGARKKSEKFEARVRFNWGYWDGRGDLQSGRPRSVSVDGPHDIQHVSEAYDRAYALGYRAGLASPLNVEQQSSEPAWLELSGAVRAELARTDLGDHDLRSRR